MWVSPSAAAAFGIAAPNRPPDGSVGINANLATLPPGNLRISTILHEIGHAIGRLEGNVVSEGVTSVSALDLVRFISPGNRLFGTPNAPTAAYFSIDGGTKKVADWSAMTPSDFLTPPGSFLSPNDPLNDRVDPGGVVLRKLTTADIQQMVALGFRVGATAVMVPRRSDGFYPSYSIGINAISTSSQLGQVGTDWQFVTLGIFND